MFDFLFGWSKASKCKKAIKRTRCRLRLLKNKRQAIVRQLRKDLAELIHSGHEETALNRVEQLIEDENLAAAYELLDQFCEFILTQLSYIRRNKDCPNDINEAVSSLIFASARCGDLPELCAIRKLFAKRYGAKFVTTAVELFPGNLVNKQLKENLSGKYVPDEDRKYRIVDEIARDNSLQQQVLAIKYYPDWQQQVKENKGYQVSENDVQIKDTTAGSKVHPSEIEEINRNVTCVNSFIPKPIESCSLPDLPESHLNYTSALVSTVQKYPPYILTYPLQKTLEKKEHFNVLLPSTTCMKNKEESMALVCSSGRVSLPSYPDDIEEYVDDIQECQFSVSKDGSCQDQMLFKFRSSNLSRGQKTKFDFGESDENEDESSSTKSSIRSYRKSKRGPEKRSRKRSASLECIGKMDIGYMIYYHKPHKHTTNYSKKHQKATTSKKIQSYQSEDDRGRKNFNFKRSGCSLNHPCYYSLYDDNDYGEALTVKPKKGNTATLIQRGVLLDECCHCQSTWDNDELEQVMELVNIAKKPQQNSYGGVAEYNEFDYLECKVGNGNNEIKEVTFASKGSYAPSANVSNPRTNVSLTIETEEVPYSRAVTMPQEWRRNSKGKILRTYSCPYQHPNHVHPKLPDYDDIAAKFTALKREHLENNKDCTREQK